MVAGAPALTAAVVLAACTLCAADYELPVGPAPAPPLRSNAHTRSRPRGYRYVRIPHDQKAMEAPLPEDMVPAYEEPIEGPLEESLEAPLEVSMEAPFEVGPGPGPVATEPEGRLEFGGAPAPGPVDAMDAEEGDLRLVRSEVSGDPAFVLGALQVFLGGDFGAVCSTRFDDADASVACRQLGFAGGSVERIESVLSVFDIDLERDEDIIAPFVLENLNCTGTEERLVDCPVATETGLDEYIQEEYFNYQYTSVGAEFGACDANKRGGYTAVLCGPLTGPEASELRAAAGGDSGDGEPEAEIAASPEEGDVRLVDKATVDNWQTGRLELFFEGAWGTVCSNGFRVADATVACRGLGLGAAAVSPRTPEGTLAQTRVRNSDRDNFLRDTRPVVTPPFFLAGGPGCDGTEAGLLECAGAQNDIESDRGDCTLGLSISCVAEDEAGVEGALRLTTTGEGDISNNPEGGVGILEVFHAGAWGTLCNGAPAAVFEDYDYGRPDDGLTEEAGLVACRQLGFEAGEFRGVRRLPADMMLRPSWLRDLPCATGTEGTIQDCGNLAFGDTSSCGLTQRLLCSDGEAEFPFLTPRLVESEVDPNGQWTYGRLEVFDGLAFLPVSDFGGSQELDHRGVQVACRELGFATGGQALAGSGSALPILEATGRDNQLGNIMCTGDEETLAECGGSATLNGGQYVLNDYDNYERSVEDNAVALVCYNPSGCEVDSTSTAPPPQQGDIRLVNLGGNPTQPCDDVHLGGVEFFNDGQWGRLCVAGQRTRSTWTVDAIVACRQLGFPFGSLMDNSGAFFDGADDENPGPQRPTWASIVFCKGTEERLDECSFIEEFGAAGTDIRGRPNLEEVICSDSRIVSVICRRFPMEESDVIRRL